MAYRVEFKKRFYNRMHNVWQYLQNEWGLKVADEFLTTVYARVYALQLNPFIGAHTGIGNVRSVHVTKHNRLYYRIEGETIVILNLYDTRGNKRK
jgi:plasmid stabilization system protein ParE